MVYGFLPWIGANYWQGMQGKRVLVLGESHYQWDRNVLIDNYPTLTIASIQLIVSGRAAGGWQSFFTKIAAAFLGCSPTQGDKKAFWQSVAFYNYIQQSAGFGPEPNPTPAMWSQSLPAFQRLLYTYHPEVIIVLGRYNWWNIQSLSGKKGPCIACERYNETRWLQLTGGSCLAYGIEHPSSRRFNGLYWHPFIRRALALARTSPLS